MAITLITGVPGTGKTAFLVSELEKIAATGRTIFVDNIPALKIEHYRAGKVTDWQKGTWLHIDRYKRTSSAIKPPESVRDDIDDADDTDTDSGGNENWIPADDLVSDADGKLFRVVRDVMGAITLSVPYESHKGALLVIDEAQRHFRPRPSGSVVPEHVAALEVHRHQGLDIWLVTQRPGLIDANVRALCGKHIALRSTPFGRYKYEWPEVGDIESKGSRDTAAKTRFRLPKHVFGLYNSAAVHTQNKHKLPMAGKILLLVVPVILVLFYLSYNVINSKLNPASVVSSGKVTTGKVVHASYQRNEQPEPEILPEGLQKFSTTEIVGQHPYQGKQFSIVGRLQSETRDIYRFSVTENGQHLFYISSADVIKSGYELYSIADCSVKLTYKETALFVTCGVVMASPSPALSVASIAPLPLIEEPQTQEPQDPQISPSITRVQQALAAPR